MPESTPIAISIVVRVVGGEEFVRRCLRSLAPQTANRPIETIVPYDRSSGDLRQLASEFPRVVFAEIAIPEFDQVSGGRLTSHDAYDICTARGLALARGDIVAIVEDCATPAPDWCDQVLEAHRLPHGVIGGAVEHRGQGLLNWAIYFLDFGRYQLPLPEKPVEYLTDVNVTYKRSALESVRDVWSQQYNEASVHWALARKGVVLWQRPQMIVYQDRGQLSFLTSVVERFMWGRLFGKKRTQEMSIRQRLAYIVLSPAIPLIIVARLARKTFGTRRHRSHFLLALPQVAVLNVCWCLGEFVEYVSGPTRSPRRGEARA
jgi:hypothetical protein